MMWLVETNIQFAWYEAEGIKRHMVHGDTALFLELKHIIQYILEEREILIQQMK